MTARQVYEGVLVEMNKIQAPSMLLEDFNYFINKAINQYINKKYNVYDVNQQSTDDMRVLKATTILKVSKTTKYGTQSAGVTGRNALLGAVYEAYLPQDYLHMLNCICNFKVKKQFKCYDPNTYVQFGATRLTADLWGQVLNNFYMKPSYKKPYYYLHNVNPVEAKTNIDDEESNVNIPTNPYINEENGTDMGTQPFKVYRGEQGTSTTTYSYTAAGDTFVEGVTYYKKSGDDYVADSSITSENYAENKDNLYTRSTIITLDEAAAGNDPYVINQTGNLNLPRTFTFSDGTKASLVEKATAQRIANPSRIRIEIRCGKDDSVFDLQTIYIDYIKAPQYIRLTQEQIDTTEDTSQMMEFPDYVCQEIINELTHLIMENSSDPRLQSHMPITMSIANPAQQQSTESSK